MRSVKRSVRDLATGVAKRFRVPVRSPAALSALTPEDLQTIGEHFARRKFFILGYPRSGTTLLGRLVRLHPEVHCNWQAHFFTEQDSLTALIADDAIGAWLARRDNRWTKDDVEPTHLVRVACDYILERQAEQEGAWIVGDKSPDAQSTLRLQTLQRIYPDAWIIYIVRDGRDVVVSRRYQQFIDLPETMSATDRRIARRLAAGSGSQDHDTSIFTPAWLQNEARQWAQDVTQTDAEGERLFGVRYLRIRYEDLVQAPKETMRGLWSFLGVRSLAAVADDYIESEMASNPAAEWHSEAAPALVAGLARGSHGGWRQSLTSDDARLFNTFAADALAYWGYPS
jgi:hypothetical protein